MKRTFLALAIAPVLMAAPLAAAADGVTVIRGTVAGDAAPGRTRGLPVIIRGMTPAESDKLAESLEMPEPEPQAQNTVVLGGRTLWYVRADGTVVACSLRASGYVDSVERDVIVCTEATVD